jgi:hypothetical protein
MRLVPTLKRHSTGRWSRSLTLPSISKSLGTWATLTMAASPSPSLLLGKNRCLHFLELEILSEFTELTSDNIKASKLSRSIYLMALHGLFSQAESLLKAMAVRWAEFSP